MGNPAPPQFQTVEFGDGRGRDTSIQPGNFANAGTRPFHLTSLKYQVLRHDPKVNQWWSSEADFTQSPCIEAVSKHMKKQFVPPRRVGLNAKMWERLGPFAPRGVSNLNDTPMNWTLWPRQISVNIRVLFMSVLYFDYCFAGEIGSIDIAVEEVKFCLFSVCRVFENAKIAIKLFQDSLPSSTFILARQFRSEIARWGENDTVEF